MVQDPNAPKSALNAFMFFSADQRPSVKEEQPELKGMGEIAKVIGARCECSTAMKKRIVT
jgi:hypothetical protein